MRYLSLTLVVLVLAGCQSDSHNNQPRRPTDDNIPPGNRPIERNAQPQGGQPRPTNDANPNQRY